MLNLFHSKLTVNIGQIKLLTYLKIFQSREQRWKRGSNILPMSIVCEKVFQSFHFGYICKSEAKSKERYKNNKYNTEEFKKLSQLDSDKNVEYKIIRDNLKLKLADRAVEKACSNIINENEQMFSSRKNDGSICNKYNCKTGCYIF